MTDWAVEFVHVTKRYRRATSDYRTLRDVLVGKRPQTAASQPGRMPALTDITLRVRPGESYAFVGPNGAGKTTALKLVARISRPSEGIVRIRGRVGALMEVGSGIHPELTARENIWLYGSILGLQRKDIEQRFEQILDFAELAHVVDRQVRYFSSGMQLRLGFAIASHLEPDVFVVDEALAVGDAAFQAKCLERMNALVGGGSTLLFVSHNLAAIEALCSRGVLLLHGAVTEEGDIGTVLSAYLSHLEQARGRREEIVTDAPLKLLSMEVRDRDGLSTGVLRPGDPCSLRFHFRSDGPIRRPHLNVGLTDGRPGLLLQCSMLLDGGAPDVVDGDWVVTLELDSLPLRPRLYQIYCDVYQADAQSVFFPWTEITSIRVEGGGARGPLAVVGDHLGAPIHVDHQWV